MNRNQGAILALVAAVGCSAKPPEPPTSAQQSGDSGGTVVTGVVKRVDVSGGCWQLVGNDSTNYELRPDQAPADLLVDQKQVTVTLKMRPDLMSNCMVGKIVDIVR